jgi:hypothetical protein
MTEINRIHAFVCGGFAVSWASSRLNYRPDWSD